MVAVKIVSSDGFKFFAAFSFLNTKIVVFLNLRAFINVFFMKVR